MSGLCNTWAISAGAQENLLVWKLRQNATVNLYRFWTLVVATTMQNMI